jgi:choline dehydrogenase-like flavoprotein
MNTAAKAQKIIRFALIEPPPFLKHNLTEGRVACYSTSSRWTGPSSRSDGRLARNRHDFLKGGEIGEVEESPGLSAGAWQMRPSSRSYVEATSNRPGDMPAINPHYLSEETERRAISGGLRLARRIFAAPALKQFVRDESLPGGHVQTDELLDYARRNGGTCYHASCTCMMGQHAMAVVDDELRVHGSTGCASSTPR